MTQTRGHLKAARIYAVSDATGSEDSSLPSAACMFNPYEYTVSQSNSFYDVPTGQQKQDNKELSQAGSQSLSLKLIFDSYESGGDIYEQTHNLWTFMKLRDDPGKAGNASKKSPPRVAFEWGGFKFISYITSLSQRYTLFTTDGTPVRAEVDITFTHYEDPQGNQNPTSGGGPAFRVHRVVAGDRLDVIAAQNYGDASKWRLIAQANDIVNPLVLRPGQVLRLPLE